MADIWRHKKTGGFYEKLSEVIDVTNDGARAIVYCRVDHHGVPQFVREATEFEEKFEQVGAGSASPVKAENNNG